MGIGIYDRPRQISSDVGCVNHKSIAMVPNGIMFKSHKGIYLLSRSLESIYIGAAVEVFNEYEIKAATLQEDKNQVIFLLSGGQPALVFDYYHSQWYLYYNHPGKDAIIYGGNYTWCDANNGNIKVSDSTYTDENFVIPLKIRTGWIKLKDLQGFQRVWKASILGKFKSHHKLVVNIYTDYNETTLVETHIFDTVNQATDEPLQFRINYLKQQLCESIQFEIYDTDMVDPYESCELTGIMLEIGLLDGMNRLPSRKSI